VARCMNVARNAPQPIEFVVQDLVVKRGRSHNDDPPRSRLRLSGKRSRSA
jgi:hypothetical protein